MMEFIFTLLASLVRGATPLLFASMGGLLSERAGIVQIALEGMMLMGALAGAIAGLHYESAWIGFACGTLAGVASALLFSLFAIFFQTDQIIVGTGLNLLAVGLAPFTTKIIFNSTGATPQLALEHRFSFEPIVIAFFAAAMVTYIYYFTKAGLLLRFAGEKPVAVTAAGYSLKLVRTLCLMGAGAFAGMGGASLSLFLASSYAPNMTAGRGFIALAALIFGKWKPIPTILACFFFASIDTLQILLQNMNVAIPGQIVQAIPYIITIVAIAGFFGESRAPKYIGLNEISN